MIVWRKSQGLGLPAAYYLQKVMRTLTRITFINIQIELVEQKKHLTTMDLDGE